ncbi:hypothetical protein [Halorussus sp. AFM4]|uniref:hypothetical protein n=1 Tax=Halorussus sp. AFM4 TaxID=3421651 RepID=UPI003EBB1B88
MAMEGWERWLDHVFFAGLEISMLSIPALVLLLFATPQGPVALAGLTAIAVSTCAAGTFRGGWVDVGEWPRPGDPYTLPLRSAYYSATVAGAAFLGAAADAAVGAPSAVVATSAAVSVIGTAALPRALAEIRSLADRLAAVRF